MASLEKIEVQKDFHGNTITFETGKVARQAGGAVIVRSGDSIVLVTAWRETRRMWISCR